MAFFLLVVLALFSGTVSAYEKVAETTVVNGEKSKLTLTEEELAWIEENRVVNVVGDADWFPFEGVDQAGNYVGIVAEVLELASQKTGIDFDFSGTSTWQHAIQLSQTQQVDIISASATNPRLKDNYRPTHSTIKNPIVIVARSSLQYVPELNSVKGLRIALANNSGYGNALVATYPSINFMQVESLDDALLGVANNQFDIAVMSMALASYLIADLGLDDLRVVGVTGLDMELTLFVNRNKPILWEIINKVKLDETDQDRSEMMSKWVKQTYTDSYSPDDMRALIMTIIFICILLLYRHHLLKKQAKSLTKLAQRDLLTNAYSRLHIDSLFLQLIEHGHRYKSTFSLLMISVDLFKQINAQYGHVVGDKILKQLSLLIEDNIRPKDKLGRWNGEVLIILCPQTSLQGALILAEKLREQVGQSIFLNVGKRTVSIGVAEYQSSETAEHCLARAEQALHVAQSSGRNQVKSEEK